MRIRDTLRALNDQREQFDSFYDRFEEKSNNLKLINKETRHQTSVRDERRRLFYSVHDNITV